MDEYLVNIITDEGEDTIKTYASSILGVVNSIVDMSHINDLGKIIRIRDDESWVFSNKISLEDLRSLKGLVKDKAQIKLNLNLPL
ncbi:hypothetical protein N9Q82_05730 [Gammaproteobacteria bacterium]|nr:hypothetical protein [Gammaproteobacteria bacterium]